MALDLGESSSRVEVVMNWPVISMDPFVQLAYEEMRAAGESHNISEMLALEQFPHASTDRILTEGHCNGNQFSDNPLIGDAYLRLARQQQPGFNPRGKIYMSSLARRPGDPEAWVPESEAKGYVKRIGERRNYNISGAVQRKRDDSRPPKPDVDLAEDIVDERVRRLKMSDPDSARKPEPELREMVRAKHKAPWK